MIASVSTLIWAFLLDGTVPSIQAEKHSLYYIYTALSKPVDLPGIYEFTAMGLLDDRQIDYYNSKEKRKIPKQPWMKEKLPEDYWDKGQEQWFNLNVHILMNRMRQNNSDLHVLQWRHGCEVEQQGDEVTFLKSLDEYGYNGENFLSFDDKESHWVAPVDAAQETKRKWDNDPTLNQYTKGYLEKECVDRFMKFRGYGDQELRSGSPPDVHVFAKRYIRYKTKLKLTCLATGFYHKDVTLNIRKNQTSLPEDEIESTGIRPNHDGSFQMRKSVEVKEDDEADYYCFVSHRTFKEPIFTKWDGKCWDCPPETVSGSIAAVIGGVLALAVVAFVVLVSKKKMIIGRESAGETPDISTTGSLEDLMQLKLQQQMYASAHAPRMGHLQPIFNPLQQLQQQMYASVHNPRMGHLLQLPLQIPTEKTAYIPVQLLQTLEDLDSHNLKRFKWFLKQYGSVPASHLENTDNTDVVDQMMGCFGPERALKLTVDILKMMNQNHLANQLENNWRNYTEVICL